MELILGDCLEKMKDIADNSIDMVLTDPPYGTTACKWDTIIDFEFMWAQLKRITKDNGAICLFGSEPFSSHLRLSNIKMFKYDWIWEKNRGSNIFLAKKQPLRVCENVSVFMDAPSWYFPIMQELTENGKSRNKRANNILINRGDQFKGSKTYKIAGSTSGFPRNILRFNLEQNNQYKKHVYHPTQKPVALLEYLIKTYTLENETVLDFTMGSGSTGVACRNLSRKFIGIEQEQNYFEIAKERINENAS
jgi:DNA modification methylase